MPIGSMLEGNSERGEKEQENSFSKASSGLNLQKCLTVGG